MWEIYAKNRKLKCFDVKAFYKGKQRIVRVSSSQGFAKHSVLSVGSTPSNVRNLIVQPNRNLNSKPQTFALEYFSGDIKKDVRCTCVYSLF